MRLPISPTAPLFFSGKRLSKQLPARVLHPFGTAMRLACRRSERWLRQAFTTWIAPTNRHASTSSAIKRGLRATESLGDRDSRGNGGGERNPRRGRPEAASQDETRRSQQTGRPSDARSQPRSTDDRKKHAFARSKSTQTQEQGLHEDEEFTVPLRVPYTTAASCFVYGSNAVLAALRAQRRRLYRLYLHPRLSAREANAEAITGLAKKLNIRTESDADVRLLNQMSEQRPHNGVVLEASRLPGAPVLSLAKPDRKASIVPLVLDRQSAEDVAVNGAPDAFPTLPETWRHPFVLMLDGILDPGNVGNILRTAHFYGVDAVVLATNTCAPLTSAALAKASSGACEALRIFSLPRPTSFVHDSAKAGWRIYAAVAPPSQRPEELRRSNDHNRMMTTSTVAQSSPLVQYPVILMLGAEGEGLRENLRNRAKHFVTIEQGERAFDGEKQADVGVDSLNVGVAAGVLVEAFMRKPEGAPQLSDAGELGF